eukprot:TRINITY_DN23521_c0_g1_i1.p1 TRINITY_DN23521_c0_g1~~TRINITY_DN23521_c0_g1_i1.p1  ORF type:complete len:412 (+),score=60.21 TRINITY_DN23521_c0_g1_i1:106-1236(+)
MAKADPGLDPVWGLLLGSVEDEVSNEPTIDLKAVPVEPVTQHPDEEAAETEADPFFYTRAEETNNVVSKSSRFGDLPGVDNDAALGNVEDKAEVSPDKFLLPARSEKENVKVTRTDVEGCDAFYLDGVLTEEECKALVEQAEGLWTFWESDPTRPRQSFRNAHTVEVTHQVLADLIWERVGHLVQPSVTLCEDDPRFEVDIEGDWVPYAMNPNLLLSRYLDGGHFSPHTDGTTVIDFNRRTFYSCVVFLNSSPWGGHTRIYEDAQMGKDLVKDDKGRLTGDPSLVLAEVPPVPGRMLVFYHRLMHEGIPAAEKYIIRTDVLYRRTPERCTAPEDVEAFQLYQDAQLAAEKGECGRAATLFRKAFRLSPALKEVYRM